MPHLIEELASGATSLTSLRSSSRIARRCGGCLAKKGSIGSPESARGAGLGAGFFAMVFLAATGFFFGLLEIFFAVIASRASPDSRLGRELPFPASRRRV